MRIAAPQPEDAGTRGEHGIPTRLVFHIVRFRQAFDDNVVQRFADFRIAGAEQPVPVRIHSFVQRLVVQQLRGPFRGMNLRNFGSDD